MTEKVRVDKTRTSKLANTLEGLHFPVDKSKILSYINQKKSVGEAQYNNTLQILLQKNLTEKKQYHNIYEIEKQAGLVGEEK